MKPKRKNIKFQPISYASGGSIGNIASMYSKKDDTPETDRNKDLTMGTWEAGREVVASVVPMAGLFHGISKVGEAMVGGIGDAAGVEGSHEFAKSFFDPIGGTLGVWSDKNSNGGEKALAALGLVAPGMSGHIQNRINKRAQGQRNKEMYADAEDTSVRGGYRLGGHIFEDGGSLNVDNINGPSHEEGGVMLTENAEAEGGETKVGDYVFSDTLTLSDGKTTFASESKKIQRKYGKRDGDRMSDESKEKELSLLMEANEQAKAKKQQEEQEMEASMQQEFLEYGGYVGLNDEGFLEVDSEYQDTFAELASKKNMTDKQYITKLFRMGGNINKFVLPELNFNPNEPVDPNDPINLAAMNKNQGLSMAGDGKGTPWNPKWTSEQLAENYPNNEHLGRGLTSAQVDDEMEYAINGKQSDFANSDAEWEALKNSTPGTSLSEETDSTTDPAGKKKSSMYDIFEGNEEESALAFSNLAAFDNLLNSRNIETTRFNRVTPQEISLENQRELARRRSTIASSVANENVRRNANSSGQALSALAANNAAINESLMESDLNSYMNEETTNAQIRNQADQTNTQIANEEVIANEQNRAMGKSSKNLALSDIGSNFQGYTKDKKMTRENNRQNERTLDVVNGLVTDYKITKDPETNRLILQYLSKSNLSKEEVAKIMEEKNKTK